MNELLFPILSLGALGLIFGILLGYASKKFAVEVDPKVPLIRDSLPGANCGGCGYAGCDAYAQAVAEGAAPPNACTVGGAGVAEKVAEIMGVSVEESEPLKAYVQCNGTCDKAKQRGEYYGTMDCQQASVVPGGASKSCQYGCLGLGSCVKACAFDAIHVTEGGIAQVDPEKCVGCGACVKACPRAVIDLKPLSAVIRVACNSKDTLKAVKDTCQVGCMTCRLCEKTCPVKAISMENNLPVVDKEKCVKCMACVKKCPTNALIAYGKDIVVKQETPAN